MNAIMIMNNAVPVIEPMTAKECPICMDTIDVNVNCVITECGHTFHTKCLLTNVAHNGFGCPYCRTEMIDIDEDEEDEGEEDGDRGDTMNTAFFMDDDDEDGDSWNPVDDDDIEDSNEGDGESNALLGMRRMFAMAEGHDGDVEGDAEEEDDEDFSDSDSEESSTSEEEEDETEIQRRREMHRMRTDLRITANEVRLEENRLIDNALPNINYITTRITSEAYGSMTFEDLTTALLRLTMWREYPQYERMIGNRIGRRLDHNLWMTLNQIIEGYQTYDHDELLEELRNNVDQAADMGMD